MYSNADPMGSLATAFWRFPMLSGDVLEISS
jgi:hypothetical protein